jgi:hypothetical protein
MDQEEEGGGGTGAHYTVHATARFKRSTLMWQRMRHVGEGVDGGCGEMPHSPQSRGGLGSWGNPPETAARRTASGGPACRTTRSRAPQCTHMRDNTHPTAHALQRRKVTAAAAGT